MCNNCGKHGHSFHQCKLPITSYGIIVFKKTSEGLKYLMIRRRNSFGYIDFIRGKYDLDDFEYIYNTILMMTVKEQNDLLTHTFEELWSDLWACPIQSIHHNQEFLDSTLSKFNETYQRRVRPYLVGSDGISDFDYSMLPINQFGFIFAWNVINFWPFQETKLTLKIGRAHV